MNSSPYQPSGPPSIRCPRPRRDGLPTERFNRRTHRSGSLSPCSIHPSAAQLFRCASLNGGDDKQIHLALAVEDRQKSAACSSHAPAADVADRNSGPLPPIICVRCSLITSCPPGRNTTSGFGLARSCFFSIANCPNLWVRHPKAKPARAATCKNQHSQHAGAHHCYMPYASATLRIGPLLQERPIHPAQSRIFQLSAYPRRDIQTSFYLDRFDAPIVSDRLPATIIRRE